MKNKRNGLNKGDKAMLSIARMQILLEKNIHWFTGPTQGTGPICSGILEECHDIIKKAKIPKKYLIAESLNPSAN